MADAIPGGRVTLADIIVEISARNTLLRSQLAEAERMAKTSTDRINATTSFTRRGFGPLGALGGVGGLARGAGVVGLLSLVPAAMKQQEAAFRLMQAAAAAVEGDWTKARSAIRQADEAFVDAIFKLPIIGGLIEQAVDSVTQFGHVVLGNAEGLRKAEEFRQRSLKNVEDRIRTLAQQKPNAPFTVQTAAGAAVVGSGQVFVADSIDRQTRTLEDMRDMLRSVEVKVGQLSLVSTQ